MHVTPTLWPLARMHGAFSMLPPATHRSARAQHTLTLVCRAGIVYSYGLRRGQRFDAAAKGLGCRVHGFDPTYSSDGPVRQPIPLTHGAPACASAAAPRLKGAPTLLLPRRGCGRSVTWTSTAATAKLA